MSTQRRTPQQLVSPIPPSALWNDRAVRLAAVTTVMGFGLVLAKQFWTPVDAAGHALDWLICLPLHVVAVIMLGRAAAATRLSPRVSLAWRLFQLSELTMVAVILTAVGLSATGRFESAQSASNAFLLSYLPILIGLLIFPVSTRRQSGMRAGHLIGTVVVALGLVVGWFVAAQPLLAASANPSIDRLLVVWAPLADLLLLAALAATLLRGTLPVHRSSLFIVAAAQLVSCCVDLLTAQMTARGAFEATRPLDGASLAATLLFGVAGAYQVVLERPESAAPVSQSILTLKVFRALVFAAIVVAYAVMLRTMAPVLREPLGGFLVATATLIGLLIVLPTVAFRDTERTLRERRTQEARFAALVQQSPDLVMVVSRECVLTYLTPSVGRALDRSPESLLGTNLLEIVHPADVSVVQQTFAGDPGTARSDPVRWRLKRADGTFVLIDARLQDRCDDPLLEAFVVNARDVTEQVKLEELARHAQKMELVGRLAGGIAHDFNNVLTVIRTSARLALDSAPAGSEQAGELREIDRASVGAAALTRRLLAFASTRSVELVRLDLSVVVGEMEPMVRRLIAKEIHLQFTLPNARVWVDGDAGYLEQVLLNLALNARDAMPRGGLLEVRLRRDDAEGSAQLTVRDTGIGMTAEVLSHLFEPFFTTKDAGVGSGLGLSTVAGILHDLRGTISVESAPGAGTAFTLKFPLREPGIITPSQSRPAVSEARGTERILVVDDDSAIRGSLEVYFGRMGYHVRVASDGRQALRLLKDDGPMDVVLTDLAMPEMNGRELVSALRKRRPMPKIICMSGYAEQREPSEDVTAGLPFLQKPFSLDELGATVRSVLALG